MQLEETPRNEAGTLRASSYIIYVDLPGDDDQWLLLHGYTGAYDRVSRRVAAFVRSREARKVPKPLYGAWEPDELQPATDWTPAVETIDRLKKRGYLTTKTPDEEQAFFVRLVEAYHSQQMRSVPHYVIMPTYDCNLRCHYCFQDHLRTDPKYRKILRVMTPSMADRIMAAFPDIEATVHEIPREVERLRKFTLFGGEPLLARSRHTIEHIVRTQQALGPCEFGAVSNATELDAFADLLGPGGISWVQITIDGPPKSHDRRRIFADQSGSFDLIARNLELALEREAKVMVRVNVDRSNFDELQELAGIIEAKGWSQSPFFSAYIAPVHDYSGTGNAGDRPQFFNSWELTQMLDALHRVDKRTRVFSRVDGGMRARVRSIFESKGADSARSAFCGAHLGMYLFDALGDIYACWDRTGEERLRIGRVLDDGKFELNELSGQWRSRNVAANSTCRQCRFALNCGGGCAVLAEGASGTIMSNFCDAFGKRFRAVVAEEYLKYRAGASPVSAEAALLQEALR